MRIPTLSDNRQQVGPLPTVRRERLVDTTGSSLGNALQSVGNQIGAIQIEEKRKADSAAVFDADMGMSQLATNTVTAAKQVKGKDAVGIKDRGLAEYDKRSAEKLNGIVSNRAKEVFRRQSAQRREQLGSQLDDIEYGERERYYTDTANAALGTSISAAASAYDKPKIVESELANQEAIIRSSPQMRGADELVIGAAVKKARESTQSQIVEQFLSNRNVGGARDYLASIDINPALRQDLQTKIDKGVIEAAATAAITAYDAAGPEAGLNALAGYKKAMRPEEYLDVLAKYNADVGQIRAQRQADNAELLTEIDTALATDTASGRTADVVDALWEAGAFTPNEYSSLSAQVSANRQKQAKDSILVSDVMKALDNGLPIDPTNTDQMKALSAVFKRDTIGLEPGTDQWRRVALSFGAKTSALPKEATQWADRAIRSGDPKLAAQAAEFVSMAELQTPTQQFDQYTKARSSIIAGQTMLGVPAEQAMTMADALMKQDKGTQETREKDYGRLTGPNGDSPLNALNNLISDDPELSIGRNPEVPVNSTLYPTFDQLSKRYYQLTGDLQRAQGLAFQDIRKYYGVSEVNGVKELALAPLERFGMDPKEVREDLALWLTENPQADGTVADDVIIQADAKTMSNTTVDGQPLSPSWIGITKSGLPLVTKNGVELRFYLPEGEDQQKLAERRAKNRAEAEKVKVLRESQQSMQRELYEAAP